MANKTTCPLDCFDGCSVLVENGKLLGDKNHPITKGYLCPHLNNWFKNKRVDKATIDGKEISLEQAYSILRDKIKTTKKDKILFYKGSGNLGKIQDFGNLFFNNLGSVIATGSLCDDGGGSGVDIGRGANLALSPLRIEDADVIILWGRNISVTNSHMLKSLKGKKLIIIDPIKISLVKNAELFLQLKPKSDIYLAILLSRLVLLEDMEDRAFIKERTDNFDEFSEFISTFSIKSLLEKCDVTLEEVVLLLNTIKGKKVSILVGTGVQRYSFAHYVLRAIDSFGALMGYFGKRGCGVGYLSFSSFGFNKPFNVTTKEDSVVNVDFSKYDLVLIQGANPVRQMPNSKKVIDSLSKVPFVVYFGLYKNESSNISNLIIPAKSFLEKDDIKFSYGHEFVGNMPKIIDNDYAFSEYELFSKLMSDFGFEHKSVFEYIDEITNLNIIKNGEYEINKKYEEYPYESGFYTENKKFKFLNDFIDLHKIDDEDGFYYVNSKSLYSVNSQFKTDNFLYLPNSSKFKDNDLVLLSSKYGSAKFEVKIDKRLRSDTALIHGGAINSNFVTPHFESQEGKCAIYQDVKVTLKKV